MASKGGQKGNKNAANNAEDAPFKSAINRLCAQENYKRIHAAADKVLTLAEQGERWATELLRDTTDGKPAQRVEQKTELSGTVEIAQRPKLTKEEWLKAHGLGTAGGAAI